MYKHKIINLNFYGSTGLRIFLRIDNLAGFFNMEVLKKLLNKRGVYNTFQVLSLFDNFRADKCSFYKKLNEFSYYNSFLRIKNTLIKNELLKIDNHNASCYYELTSKGKEMFVLLKKLDELLK